MSAGTARVEPAAAHGLRRCERGSASALQAVGTCQARVADTYLRSSDAQAPVIRRTRPVEAARILEPELSRRAERGRRGKTLVAVNAREPSMVRGCVRAASRGLRGKASERDASNGALLMCASCLSPRLFTNRKPTPPLSNASRYAPTVHIRDMSATPPLYRAPRATGAACALASTTLLGCHAVT